MKLRKYDPELDFRYLKCWISDEKTHALWCAKRIPFPLDKISFDNVVNLHYEKYGDVPFIAETEDGQAVGFFCCSSNNEDHMRMLRFVVVDNSLRGRGFGKEMLDMAVRYAFDSDDTEAVMLNVFSVNERAVRCYKKAGFKEVSVTPAVFSYDNERWDRITMVINK